MTEIRTPRSEDLDGLRLIALGKIPRCEGCPRYRALVAIHEHGAPETRDEIPPPLESCTLRVCEPLAAHYLRSNSGPEVHVTSR